MKGVLVMAPLLLLTTLCTVVVILLYSKYYEDERIVAADSRMVRQWRELAMRLYRSHDYRDAELMLNRIVKAEPEDFFARRALGKIYMETGRYAVADELYRELLVARPEDAVSRNNLGVALIRCNKIEAGIRELKIASRITPYAPYITGNLAEAYQRLGDAGQADYYLNRTRATMKNETLLRPTPIDAVAPENLSVPVEESRPYEGGEAVP